MTVETPKILTEEAAENLARKVDEIFAPHKLTVGEIVAWSRHDASSRPRAEDEAVKRKRIKRKKQQRDSRRKNRGTR